MDEVGGDVVVVGPTAAADLVRHAQELLGKALDEDASGWADDRLGVLLSDLNRIARDVDRLAGRVISQVDRRRLADSYRVGRPGGYRSGRGSCLVEWTRQHAADMPTSQRLCLVRLAQSANGAEDALRVAAASDDGSVSREQAQALVPAPTLAAFDEGTVRTFRADRVMASLNEAAPFLRAAHGDEMVDAAQWHQRSLLRVAASGSDREVRVALARFVGGLEPATDAASRDRAQAEARALSESSGPGGTTDFTVRADPVNAAILRAVVNDLSGPQPDDDGPDPRTAAQRRFDALMTVVTRGMRAPETHDATPAVSLVVTLSADDLARVGFGKPYGQPLRSDSGVRALRAVVEEGERSGTGVAVDGYGHPVPLGQLRRLACHADVIPAVLGGPSVPLDLGRTSRLASAAQRRALHLRDRQCTWPGCTVPPAWCHAHHLTPWSRGGMTDLAELALLCPRHHTIAHDRGSTARLVDGRVRWDVGPPGSGTDGSLSAAAGPGEPRAGTAREAATG